MSSHCESVIEDTNEDWLWVSSQHGCSVFPPDADTLFETIKGHDVLFVGDSLSENQFISLCCRLSKFLAVHDDDWIAGKPVESISQALSDKYLLGSSPLQRTCPLHNNTLLRFVWSNLLFADVAEASLDHFRRIWTELLDTRQQSQLVLLTLSSPSNQHVMNSRTSVDHVVFSPVFRQELSLALDSNAFVNRTVFLRSSVPPHHNCSQASAPQSVETATLHPNDASLHLFFTKSLRQYHFLDARPLLLRPDQHSLEMVDGVVDCTTYCTAGPVNFLSDQLFSFLDDNSGSYFAEKFLPPETPAPRVVAQFPPPAPTSPPIPLAYPNHPLELAEEFLTCKHLIDSVLRLRHESLESDYPHTPLAESQFVVLHYTPEVHVPGTWVLQLKILDTKHWRFWCDLRGIARVMCVMDYSHGVLTLSQKIVDGGIYDVFLDAMTIQPGETGDLLTLAPLWYPVPLPQDVKQFTASVPDSISYTVDFALKLPLCPRRTVEGRWLSIPSVVRSAQVEHISHLSSRAIVPGPSSAQFHHDLFLNTSWSGAGYVFMPYGCAMRWYSKPDVMTCMQSKGLTSISLMGTSRTRTEVYDLNVLLMDSVDAGWRDFTWASKVHSNVDFYFGDGYRVSYVWGISTLDLDEYKHWVGSGQAEFLRESLKREGLCQNPPASPSPKGALFISTGLWELKMGQWEDYPAFTDKLLHELRYCTEAEKKVIFFKTSEPLVLAKETVLSGAVWQQEWETRCAIDKFSAAGFPIIDSRIPMMSRSDSSHDGLHYYLFGGSDLMLGNAVSVTLAQILLNALCLEDDG